MQGRFESFGGIGEVEAQGGLDVSAALGSARRGGTAAAATAPEHLPEHVAETVGTNVEVEATAATLTAAEATDGAVSADLVVLLALGFVAQHVVGRADRLEPLFGCGVTRMGVWMTVTGELAIRLGDVFRRGVFADAEDLVVVLLVPLSLRGHPDSPP
jgi:hypothetical protein